ncbi:hypothetical protein ACROYT_G004423 [Oculina patagonica]
MSVLFARSQKRISCSDTANTETIDRILNAAETNTAEELKWHKSCYAKYTDKGKISRYIGILGPRTVERALAGKDYNKATRVHKITLQAMWQFLLPQLLAHIEEKGNELKQSLEKSVQSKTEGEFLNLPDLLSSGQSTLVVDGQALVMGLGRPSECNTFDDLADKFVKAVLVSEKDFDRIDVTFDRYRESSIKCATKKKRSPGHVPIRRGLVNISGS